MAGIKSAGYAMLFYARGHGQQMSGMFILI